MLLDHTILVSQKTQIWTTIRLGVGVKRKTTHAKMMFNKSTEFDEHKPLRFAL